MTWVLLALTSVAILLAAASFYATGVGRLLKRKVVVHTKDDRSIQGVLTGHFRDALMLSAPRYLDEAQPHDLPGEVLVPRSNVAWIQAPPAS